MMTPLLPSYEIYTKTDSDSHQIYWKMHNHGIILRKTFQRIRLTIKKKIRRQSEKKKASKFF